MHAAGYFGETSASQKGILGKGLTQYILSAATIPNSGTKSIEVFVKRKFRDCLRVNTTMVHAPPSVIEQQWVNCTTIHLEDRVDEIVSAINAQQDGKIPSTMVFANTAAYCQTLASALKVRDIECVEFHKLVPVADKRANLDRFRDGDVPVLVCTDSVARGIDIPRVRHVVQAQFALNAVHHLHRVGRASRGGRAGRATNFFDATSQALVDSIRAQETVERSFSRRRGFRSKLRRLALDGANEDEESELRGN
jgi:superfamily II DNA/RNA helicase